MGIRLVRSIGIIVGVEFVFIGVFIFIRLGGIFIVIERVVFIGLFWGIVVRVIIDLK